MYTNDAFRTLTADFLQLSYFIGKERLLQFLIPFFINLFLILPDGNITLINRDIHSHIKTVLLSP